MNDIKKVLIVAICVVLVIAIAAGVSIGVMANTMNGLKDRVEELDQAYASDVAAMKAEIEAAKAANENLVTAADFEAKLAAAIGEQNQTMQSLISTAVKNQIEDLEVEGLTEEQVNEIIDAAVANCLTEADIDAIIADIDTGLTKDEVKKLITNNTAGYLTYAQIANMIDDADYDLRKFLEDTLKEYTDELGKRLDADLDGVKDQIGKVESDVSDLEQSTSSYVVDTAKKTVTIASAKGLVDWANDTNNGKSWHGYTITLAADIDLAGIVWEPVQIDWFDTIIFDGGYHIISNLTVESHVAVEDGGNKFVGFFGKVGAITVKDVTFDNADITAPAGDATYAGVVAAYAYDSVNSNVASYENIAVINSTVYGEDKCGGLFGFFGEEDFTMKNITVANCVIGSEKADAAGGVVGRVGKILITVEKLTYKNNTLVAKNDNKGEIDGKNSRATAADFATELAAGGRVILGEDVTYDTAISNDVEINLAGKTFEATATIELKDNSNLTMTGGDYVVNSTYGHVDVRPSTTDGSEVVFEDVDFSYNKLGPTCGPCTDRLGSVVEVCATVADAKTTIIFKNCTLDNAMVLFEGLSGTVGEIDATFENCTFNALTSSAPIKVQNYVKGTITVKGCTFNLECTSSTASAISISPSTSTSVTLNAENNTINATAATPTDSTVTGVDVVKVNGTPANIKFVSASENSIVTETNTTKTGIAK